VTRDVFKVKSVAGQAQVVANLHFINIGSYTSCHVIDTFMD